MGGRVGECRTGFDKSLGQNLEERMGVLGMLPLSLENTLLPETNNLTNLNL